jgi:hypothetical protein
VKQGVGKRGIKTEFRKMRFLGGENTKIDWMT